MRPENERPSPRERLRRSRLYLPGSQPKFLINAALHRPDGVILDLEDSVAPSDKAAARVLVRNALRFLDWGDAERMVRINPLPAGLADPAYVVGHGAQMISS
jgi:citrate lyase subunit beta/citryl-CoA lyase